MNESNKENNFKIDESYRKTIDEALDKFEYEIAGLHRLDTMKAPEYLYMSIDVLRKKSPEELAEAFILINQYSLYIQRIINRNKAWERWAKSKLEEVACFYLPEVDMRFGSYERMQIAKNSPQICKRLNSFIRNVSMQSERLHDVPNNIKLIADSIRELKFIAMRKEKLHD